MTIPSAPGLLPIAATPAEESAELGELAVPGVFASLLPMPVLDGEAFPSEGSEIEAPDADETLAKDLGVKVRPKFPQSSGCEQRPEALIGAPTNLAAILVRSLPPTPTNSPALTEAAVPVVDSPVVLPKSESSEPPPPPALAPLADQKNKVAGGPLASSRKVFSKSEVLPKSVPAVSEPPRDAAVEPPISRVRATPESDESEPALDSTIVALAGTVQIETAGPLPVVLPSIDMAANADQGSTSVKSKTQKEVLAPPAQTVERPQSFRPVSEAPATTNHQVDRRVEAQPRLAMPAATNAAPAGSLDRPPTATASQPLPAPTATRVSELPNGGSGSGLAAPTNFAAPQPAASATPDTAVFTRAEVAKPAVPDRNELAKSGVPAQPHPVHTAPAKVAVPQMAAAFSAANATAKTSPELPAAVLVSVSQSAAIPDQRLISEEAPGVKRTRGTTGAKPIRDMIDAATDAQNLPLSRESGLSASARPVTNSAITGKLADRVSDSSISLGRNDIQHVAQSAPEIGGYRFPLNEAPASPAFFPGAGTITGRQTFPEATNIPATPTASPMSLAAIVDDLGLTLEKLQPRGQQRLDLNVPLEGGGEVRIELEVHDGAVRAAFFTDSVELRDALQKGWPQLATRGEGLGLALSEPVFKAPAAASNQFGQSDFRERRQDSPSHHEQQRPAPYFTPPTSAAKRGAQPVKLARPTARGLSTWA